MRSSIPLRLLIVLMLGLALRLGYAWYGHRGHYLPTSSDGYETIALSLLDRGEYSIVPGIPTSMREPSYPLFIAATYSLFGRHPGLIIFIQCLLSVATGLILWRIGRELFDDNVALAALSLFMIYPQSIYYSAYFFRETWLCFWFAVLLWSSLSWSSGSEQPSGTWKALAGGIAAAIFGLSNSAVLPACFLSGVLIWFCAPSSLRVRRMTVYFLPFVAAFGLWSARNYRVQGQFVLGSTHGGEEFLQALVVPPEDLGTPRQTQIIQATPIFSQADALPEAQRNSYLMKASLAWIAAHPGTYFSRSISGLLKYWKPWPYRRNYQHSYWLLVLMSLLFDGWIIPLGFIGMWRYRSLWRKAPAFPASVFAMTIVYGMVHAVIRYRLPLMGGMILLACAAMVSSYPGHKRQEH